MLSEFLRFWGIGIAIAQACSQYQALFLTKQLIEEEVGMHGDKANGLQACSKYNTQLPYSSEITPLSELTPTPAFE